MAASGNNDRSSKSPNFASENDDDGLDREQYQNQNQSGRRQRTPAVASRVKNASRDEQQAMHTTRQQLIFPEDGDEEDFRGNYTDNDSAIAATNGAAFTPSTKPKNPPTNIQPPVQLPPLTEINRQLPDQAVILERLNTIRLHKRRVLDMIDKLRNESADGEVDRDMLRKLIDAYDSFKEQEEQYLSVLQKILVLKARYATALEEEEVQVDTESPAELVDTLRDKQPIVGGNMGGLFSPGDRRQQESVVSNAAAGIESANDEFQALVQQRNVLQQMLRQQEELRALQGRHRAQEGRRQDEAQALLAQDCESARRQVADQQAMLAAKRQELEELKRKLEFVRSVGMEAANGEEVRKSDDAIQLAGGRHHVLDDKLRSLRSKKQRMDEIITELNALQESQGENAAYGSAIGVVQQQMVHSPVAAIGNQTGARPKQILPKPAPKKEPARNASGGQMPPDSIRKKLQELEATKARLAQLQSLVAEVEESGGRTGVPEELMRLVNEVERESATEDIDDTDTEMAALSLHMKSAYQSKLDEQRDAVDKLQEEHMRLMAIKNQLLKLNPLTDTLAAERLFESIGEPFMNHPIEATNEEMLRDLRHDLRQQPDAREKRETVNRRSSESCATPDQRLNNTRDNLSVSDFSAGARRNIRQNMNPHAAAASYNPGVVADDVEIDSRMMRSRHDTDSSSAIVSNPRLASFRRNNQLDDFQTHHRQSTTPTQGGAAPVNQQQQQHQSATGRTRSAHRESVDPRLQSTPSTNDKQSRHRRPSVNLEQQYQQLQRHIDSIRCIFQDLMKEHEVFGAAGQPTQPGPVAGPVADALLFSGPPNAQAMASLYAGAPQTWDPFSMNPSALAAQQQQLTLSLLACQQQLHLQQAEMRYLQQLCQDMYQQQSSGYGNNEDGRTRSGSVASIHQQQQQSAANPIMTPLGNVAFPPGILPPFDGRPLSSASLYNLLAPNPYLTLPYYSPQLAHATQHQQNMARNLSRSMTVAGAHSLARQGGVNGGSLNNSYIGGASRPPLKSNRNAESTLAGARMSSSVCQSASNGTTGCYDGQTSGLAQRGMLDRMIVSDSELSLGDTKTTSAAPKPMVPKLNLDETYKSNVAKNQKNSNVHNQTTNGVPELPSRASSTSGAVTHSSHSVDQNGLTPDQFDAMREVIYSEVATLISQNEQRPSFLLELFRELQLLSSDYLRSRALEAIRDILNRYLTDDTEVQYTDQENDYSTSIYRVRSISDTPPVAVGGDFDEDRRRRTYQPVNLSRNNSETVVASSSVSSTPDQSMMVSANETLPGPEKGASRQKRFENLEDIKDVKNLSFKNTATAALGFKTFPETNDRSIPRIQNRDFAGLAAANGAAAGNSRVDVTGLEQQIQAIVDDLIPFLRGNVDAECSSKMLEYLRKLVLELTTSKCVPPESVSTFFRLQLSSILDDTLAKFKGQKLHECGAELLADVSEVVFNELAFFRLMQNIDTTMDGRLRERAGEADAANESVRIVENGPVAEGMVNRTGSEIPSSQQSSEDELSPMSGHDALSELSEDLSAITAVSISRQAVKIAAVSPGTASNGIESTGRENKAEAAILSEDRPKRRVSDGGKSVETVMTRPLMVQVTAATDEEEITTTNNTTSSSSDAGASMTSSAESATSSSSSSNQSMHTAGGGGSVTGDQADIRRSTPSDSRETTPPEDMLEAEDIPEQLENGVAQTADINDVSFDLTFEPHPENQVQLTLSVKPGPVAAAAVDSENEEEEEEEEESERGSRPATVTENVEAPVRHLMNGEANTAVGVVAAEM